MKNSTILVLRSFILLACVMLIIGCDKDKVETETTIQDVEGNSYNTTKIGTQVWMASELKTTKFCDGTPIPLVTDANEWDNTNEAAYCWYDNDENLFDFALYNWYAVESGCLCPEGWHVPSAVEWDILEDFLGGQEVAGGKLKRPDMWLTANHIGSNDYGFNAIPTRRRKVGAGFLSNNSEEGGWWTSTPENATESKTRYLRHEVTELRHGFIHIRDGITVRCIQD